MAHRASEREIALARAKELMDETDTHPSIDPDDDLRLLSRQLLRGQEVIDKLKADLNSMHDPMGDLIQANRDQILKMHEEAIRRISKVRKREGNQMYSLGLIDEIVEALNTFHPMHTESWQGWPKESD